MCPKYVCITERVPTKLSRDMQWSFARWIPDDSKELNEICSNSRKAYICNSILSQTSGTYTQDLTPVRYFYLLFMGLHLGRLAHTPCLWASLQHLQVHWCLKWRHSSPREQWRETTHSNLIRPYDFCLCRVPSHQEGNGLGPACNNASNWSTMNNIIYSEIAGCLSYELFFYQNAYKTLSSLPIAWQHWISFHLQGKWHNVFWTALGVIRHFLERLLA